MIKVGFLAKEYINLMKPRVQPQISHIRITNINFKIKTKRDGSLRQGLKELGSIIKVMIGRKAPIRIFDIENIDLNLISRIQN